MSTTRVAIRHLTKVIGRKTIVDDLSFDIPAGEVFGLLGPNGAGKTTTMRMMVGLIRPTRGTVHIEGVEVRQAFAEAMRHVGAIVENPEMYGYLSGYLNLLHFARMSPGIGRARIDEVVQQVGLAERIHDRVRTYSLGMRQRLGLAQAMLRQPHVLILDEPTNGLDPAGIRELRDSLRRLARHEGTSVVVSSHLLSEMELMCDRVAIIQAGKLVDVRTVGEIADNGDVPWVAVEADALDTAEAILKEQFPDRALRIEGAELWAPVGREDVPDLIAALVTAGVRVYGVRAVRASLEDRFLEITGGGSIG